MMKRVKEAIPEMWDSTDLQRHVWDDHKNKTEEGKICYVWREDCTEVRYTDDEEWSAQAAW